MQNLLPSLSIDNHIDPETSELMDLMYRVGNPRSYRFDAGKGIITLNGELNITTPGQEFHFIPVAMRVFNDDLFRQGPKNWAEIFFVNCDNQLCSMLIHGFSVDNLGRLANDLYYEKKSISEVIIKMKPEKKQNKAGDNFYVADFSIAAADDEVIDTFDQLVKAFDIYRQDTLTTTSTLIEQLNYVVPSGALPSPEIN